MRERIYRMIGKVLLKLTALRNGAWEATLRREFRSIDSTTILEYPLKVTNPGCVTIGARTRISWCGRILAMTEHLGRRCAPEIVIGDDCYLGNHVHIVATNRILIGKKVMLADRVFLSDHWPDQSSAHAPAAPGASHFDGEVHIGEGSWIGENVSVAGDIRIGRHSVVGANAVVTRNLPAYSVAVGVPARIIRRYNFSSGQWAATDPDGEFLAAHSRAGPGLDCEKISRRRKHSGKKKPAARSP